jgi:peroxiredoxin Q/BCP
MHSLQVGDHVPNFSGTDDNGKIHHLNDYKGKKLILFFFPKANTPGCINEVCNLRDNYTVLIEAGYSLLGVSADTIAKQNKFATKFDLPFPLIADEQKSIINLFGVWGPKNFMGNDYEGIYRTTFIIDEQGVVERVYSKVKTKEHATQILEEV